MSDEDLLLAYYAGDDRAFNELDATYRQRLIQFALFRLPATESSRFETACDLAQETLIKVARTKYVRSSRWQPGRGTVKGWIGTIHRNTVTDYLRKEHRGEVPFTDLDAGGDGDSADGPDEIQAPGNDGQVGPLARAIADEELKALRDCICSLVQSRREVVILRCFEEMTHAEIAEVLGISTEAVAQRFHRAIAELTACMKNKRF